MLKHTDREIEKMIELMKIDIKQSESFSELNLTEEEMVQKYRSRIVEILDAPLGVLLAPDEIAEMIIFEELL